MHASKEDQDGRYYKKSLKEVDELSLVRDRIGQVETEDLKKEPEEKAKGDTSAEDPVIEPPERDRPSKSRRQLHIEDEWELHRSSQDPLDESEAGEKVELAADSYETDEEYEVHTSTRLRDLPLMI